MTTITAISRQKRNPDRVNLYLDGNFAFGLAAIAAVGLKIGQTLTEAEIAALQKADELEKAKLAAIRYIEYRPRSVREVEKKLRDKGYDDPVIQAVVERLQEVALLDDAAFARYWVEQRETFRPRSRMALQQELRQKGIGRQQIDEAVAEVDEYEAARRAAQKKLSRWQQLDEAGFKQKMGGFLQRRGFPYEIIRDIIATFWEEIATHADDADDADDANDHNR